MWITDDSDVLFLVLEIHDKHLLVRGPSGIQRTITPPDPDAVLVMYAEGDPVNMICAAQALGYDLFLDIE